MIAVASWMWVALVGVGGTALGLMLAWAYSELASRVTLGQRIARLELLCTELEAHTAEHREIHKAATDAIESMRAEMSGGNVSTEIRDLKDSIALLKIRVNAN